MSSSSRVLLTIVISLAILVAWQYLFAPKPPKIVQLQQEQHKQQKQQKQQKQEVSTGDAASKGPSAEGDIVESKDAGARQAESSTQKNVRQPTVKRADAEPAVNLEGTHTTFRTHDAVVRFTSSGAALRSWVLTEPRYKEPRNGKLAQVDLVQTLEEQGPWPLQTTFEKSDFEVPPFASFTKVRSGEREVIYRWQSEKVSILKHYVLDAARSLVWLTLKVHNRTEENLRQRLQISLYNRQDPNQAKAGFANPFPKISMIMCHVNSELQRRTEGSMKGESSGCNAAGCGIGEGPLSMTGQVRWIGAGDRYFLTAVVPQNADEERRCELKPLENNIIQASMQFSEKVLGPGKTSSRRFAVFVGAKDLQQLDTIKGADSSESKLGESIEFGWFAVLCRPMLWLMKVFYGWFGNWGVAIILLTIVVKLLTLYWTQKSMRSMKEMQRLKPKMDELREKFKDDKQRLNQEMMALYKVHKVNPLGGCLPMLIQMPVWFALYRTLGNSVELYRSSFVGWITDLTAPDPYFVLPIAMGISMYAQQAITPTPMEGTQAKMMKYFMPGMFTFMMLWLPSGLTLYIFVNTVLTMIHQWYMNKTDPGGVVKVKQGDPAGSAAARPQRSREAPVAMLPTQAEEGGRSKTKRRRRRRKK